MTTAEKAILKKFGKRLKELRKERKLSLRQLSYNCKVDFSKIAQMEKGLINPTLLTLTELSKGLEIELQYLFSY
jgi:transcriptional regulator with XRE-family HTH domain